ncbi:mitochondrial amidoxime-reducing component 1 [Fukomys damarensis]|uniref:mitochondrial amidoxime-reducing component 1 n=1 Tax=Fukomys damarensis TaxID=885580 RepID=UPI001454FFE3|nr:mitochondrial amidoxime-reducing component 1 [Fukomys damarensis]
MASWVEAELLAQSSEGGDWRGRACLTLLPRRVGRGVRCRERRLERERSPSRPARLCLKHSAGEVTRSPGEGPSAPRTLESSSTGLLLRGCPRGRPSAPSRPHPRGPRARGGRDRLGPPGGPRRDSFTHAGRGRPSEALASPSTAFALTRVERRARAWRGLHRRAWHKSLPELFNTRNNVGTVAQLWVYPIKSCRGVAVPEAEVTALGLRVGHLRDRFWLVINEDENMVTARQEPRMVLISLSCEGDTLTLSAAYTKDLLLPIKTPATNPVRTCRVHGLEVQGRDCGEAAAQWITSFLQSKPYRLVHFEPHMRPRSSQQVRAPFGPLDQVAYSDASPFLVLSEASLADLNSRLEKKVKATNFRPNIVISGCGVYEEDTWDELLVGNTRLRRVMACSRCVLTTVDPDTGIMNRKEPLETLRSYRQCDPSEQKLYGKLPLFGQYFALESPGKIRLGDAVYLLG